MVSEAKNHELCIQNHEFCIENDVRLGQLMVNSLMRKLKEGKTGLF